MGVEAFHPCQTCHIIDKGIKMREKNMRERRNRFSAKFMSLGCPHVHLDAYYNGVLLKEDNVVARIIVSI